jgi:uncharacterized protein (DUF1501 family)
MASSTPSVLIGPPAEAAHVLVTVFLRGGADGLNMVAPYGDDTYLAARPGIGIRKTAAVDLDGFFGFHPKLAPLQRLWKDGTLSIVHQAGSEDSTRSHFEAQDFMEHGGLVGGGWLGRFLRARPDAGQSPLTAVALGSQIPEVLRGAPACAAVQSLEEFSLPGDTQSFTDQLMALYGATPGLLGHAGGSALAALRRIESLTQKKLTPENGATYAKDPFSNSLSQVARLIRSDCGLQAATLDLGGWDSHITSDSIMSGPMERLAAGLTAFTQDLGPALQRTTIVVMSEFGRRVAENSALGTDHGSGGVMMLLGAGIAGGRIHAQWKPLREDGLIGPGDLPVVHNYRDVLAPILLRHAPGTDLARVFPEYTLQPISGLA